MRVELMMRVAVVALAPVALGAQTPTGTPPTIEACYVPASGTIYRINTAQSPAAGAPSACLNVAHVRFTWNQQGPVGPTGQQGAPGPAGTLSKNALGQFNFDNVNGFMAKGAQASGSSIADNARGTLLLWHPKTGSFRAGRAAGEWDEQNIGLNSVAMGMFPVASGWASVALGRGGVASGYGSVALGVASQATNDVSVAIGQEVEAHGDASLAMGSFTKAIGNYSVALGRSADASFDGSFVFGDASSRSVHVKTDKRDQFLARASGGVVFQVNPTGTVGCYLSQTSGGWQCTSDRNRKTDFMVVDGERLLDSLRALPITTWRYRTDSTQTTHLGPTAQDFQSAFSVGADSLTIGAVDAQGVALAAAKALEARTRTLSVENAVLRSDNAELRAQLAALAARLTVIETRSLASGRGEP